MLQLVHLKLPLLSLSPLQGRTVIPQALIAAQLTFLVLSFWTTAVIFFSFPNQLDMFVFDVAEFPLNYGFEYSMHISEQVGTSLTIIPNFASGMGFMYASLNLTQALSLSGLFSPFFKPVWGPGKSPYRALLACSLLQFTVLLIGYYCNLSVLFFPLTMLGASASYVGTFCSYLTFFYKFENMERLFRSPFGVYGAYTGIAVFVLLFIAILGFDPHNYIVVPVYFGIVLAAIIYYYFVAEKRQFFSHEEQQKFMKAYILNGKRVYSSRCITLI